jgi:dCMP deaminase
MRASKWDARFLELAALVASWSKDPSTKVGAVIVDGARRVLGVGYNGFPRGTSDAELYSGDRDEKLRRVVHGEANAILNAPGLLTCTDATLYVVPLPCCSSCAGLVIQAGIKRVVCPRPNADQLSRWRDSLRSAESMFMQAGVVVDYVDGAEQLQDDHASVAQGEARPDPG